jgi:hypothetical protein
MKTLWLNVLLIRQNKAKPSKLSIKQKNEILRRGQMNFFRKIQNYFRKKSKDKFIYPEYGNYRGSGCIFTDGKHILGGYQKKGSQSYISGIGGKTKDEESYIQTAIREMIEEILEAKDVPPKLIKIIEETVQPGHIYRNRFYINVVYSFEDLVNILKIIHKNGIKTNLYKSFPKTINDLVFNRIIPNSAEITHLCILPLVKHDLDYDFVDLSFITDMQLLLNS